MLLRGYLGSLGRRRVLGRWKDTEYRVLRDECPCAPCSAAFFAALALLSFGVEPSVINHKHRRCMSFKEKTDSWQPPCPWWILSSPLVESVIESKRMSMGFPECQNRKRLRIPSSPPSNPVPSTSAQASSIRNTTHPSNPSFHALQNHPCATPHTRQQPSRRKERLTLSLRKGRRG